MVIALSALEQAEKDGLVLEILFLVLSFADIWFAESLSEKLIWLQTTK